MPTSAASQTSKVEVIAKTPPSPFPLRSLLMARNPFADDAPLFEGAPAGDEPLFLHPSNRDRLLENTIGLSVGAVIALTFLFSLWTGIGQSWNNIFLGLVLLAFSGVTYQLILWYRSGDLDPKFKTIILVLFSSDVLLAIIANVYFFAAKCPGQPASGSGATSF
ncbi:uncharacterized protein EV422DRAFT_525169 [Fimicolochytrium jonesii]|uniref:uncharacterized protein n=1 Tax=Fimicolochytrium jonesii TaxID=1396493 RepID=UPI0022FEBD34|nr:uncharacterized protein EV422DRAFT_525169 [Fimicolochytrium jonesii]KAI8821976.1 hypothetical protein EV422DRAFT_525169 [Fimicolochytrium jonesii]